MSSPDPDALYVALIGDPSRLSGLRRMTYRCDTRRCLLLDAVVVADKILMHQKRFKQSDAVNQSRSSEDGRRANTFDGNNHWKPQTFFQESSALAWFDAPAAGQAIQCDHVGVLPDGGQVMLRAEDFEADWEAGHTEVRVRKDGTRFAV